MIPVFIPVYFHTSLAAPKWSICSWIYVLKQFQRMQPILNDIKIWLLTLEQSKNFSLRDLVLVFDVGQKLCHQSVVLCCAVQIIHIHNQCVWKHNQCVWKHLPWSNEKYFYIMHTMNPLCTHTFIHSVRSFSLLPSMGWVLLFRCLLSDCLPADYLPTVWFVCLTDRLHDWLSTFHVFTFWSVCLSSYHFTERLVDWMTSVCSASWFLDVYLFTDRLRWQAGCWLTDMVEA